MTTTHNPSVVLDGLSFTWPDGTRVLDGITAAFSSGARACSGSTAPARRRCSV